jgi:hypothetical protein
VAEHGGGGGGSVVGTQTLGALECGRRPDTEVGLDGGRARRRYWSQSVMKHGRGRGGSGTVDAWGVFFMFFM